MLSDIRLNKLLKVLYFIIWKMFNTRSKDTTALRFEKKSWFGFQTQEEHTDCLVNKMDNDNKLQLTGCCYDMWC